MAGQRKQELAPDPQGVSDLVSSLIKETAGALGNVKRVEVQINDPRHVIIIMDTAMNEATPQEKYRNLYTILSWISGFIFLALLLGLFRYSSQTQQNHNYAHSLQFWRCH